MGERATKDGCIMVEKNTNIALPIDFDNMAIGAEDSLKSRFELDKVMER